MPRRRKTVKFTYEGSSKFIKFIYLLGRIILNVGVLLFFVSMYFAFKYITGYMKPADAEMYTNVFVIISPFIACVVVGNCLVWLAQFLNWWDRGSINSKIFR